MDKDISLNGSQTEPAPSPSPTARISKRKLVIILLAILLALCAIGATVIYIISENTLLPSASRSFKKTFSSITKESEPLFEIFSDKSEITVSGTVKKDMYTTVTEEGAPLEIRLLSDPESGIMRAEGSIGSGDSLIGGSARYDGKSIEISSDSLLDGKTYALYLTELASSLKGSVFAYDSKSGYALDRETYDALIEYSEALESYSALTDDEIDTLSDTAKYIGKRLKKHLTVEKTKGGATVGELTVDSGTLYAVTFDEEAIYAVLDAVVIKLRYDEELIALVDSRSTIPEGEKRSPSEYLADTLLDARDALAESGQKIEGKITYIVKSGYMLAFSLDITYDVVNNSPFKTNSVRLLFETGGDPKNDRSFTASLTSGGSDIAMVRYTEKRNDTLELTDQTFALGIYSVGSTVRISQTSVKADNGELSATLNYTITSIGDGTVEYRGSVKNTKKELGFTLSYLKYGDGVIINGSALEIKAKAASGLDLRKSADAVDILTMTKEDVDGARARYNTVLREKRNAVNSAFGKEIITTKKTVALKEAGWLLDTPTGENYIYDEASGAYYLGTEINSAYYLVRLDPAHPEQKISVQTQFQPACITVNNGILAHSYGEGGINAIVLRDATTLELIDTVTQIEGRTLEEVMDMELIGNTLALSLSDQFSYVYTYDLTAKTFKRLDLGRSNPYYALLAIDRERGLLAIGDRRSSSCNLVIYSLTEDKTVYTHSCGASYNKQPIYFRDGYCFAYDEVHYIENGVWKSLDYTALTHESLNSVKLILDYGDKTRAVYHHTYISFFDTAGNELYRTDTPEVVGVTKLPDGDLLVLTYAEQKPRYFIYIAADTDEHLLSADIWLSGISGLPK